MPRDAQVLAGRYELGPLLGAGGMARVYLATDRVLERTVAVKVLSPPYDRDPAFVERFRREARAAAALNHPNIVAIFDSGSAAGTHYLVMEYVQGHTLVDLLRRQGVLAPGRAVEVARWVCQALAAAHAEGLVHRDIKPANVLVSQTGLVKVADFGIATAAGTPALTGGAALLGTAAYLSPEQAQGREVDARSDVYALGCVLYELLTGAPPFVADSPMAVLAQQVAEAPTPPSQRNPQVGPDLDAVVMTALAKEPARRYQTATAMGQELVRIVGRDAAGVRAPPWPVAAGSPGLPTTSSGSAPTAVVAARAVRGAARRPGWTRWSLAAGTGLVGLLAGVWWLGGGPAIISEQGAPAATTAPTALTTTTVTTRPPTTSTTTPFQPGVRGALARLRAAIMAGERQGTIDPDAEDLLHQADDVVRAVREDDADKARNKLEELRHKVDELIDEGKIAPAAAGGVRQAVAQLARAVRHAPDRPARSSSDD
jgi:Protein kinase domain